MHKIYYRFKILTIKHYDDFSTYKGNEKVLKVSIFLIDI